LEGIILVLAGAGRSINIVMERMRKHFAKSAAAKSHYCGITGRMLAAETEKT